MTNLTINFNFPTRKNAIKFVDIPNGPFMGHVGGGATNNDMLQLKGPMYTYNLETQSLYYNSAYEDHLVYSYSPVAVTVTVDDIRPPEPIYMSWDEFLTREAETLRKEKAWLSSHDTDLRDLRLSPGSNSNLTKSSHQCDGGGCVD